VSAAKGTIADMRALVKKWETIMPQVREGVDPTLAVRAWTTRSGVAEVWVLCQITSDERQEVLDGVLKVEKWLEEKLEEQAKKAPHEAPAFLAKDLAPRFKTIKDTVGWEGSSSSRPGGARSARQGTDLAWRGVVWCGPGRCDDAGAASGPEAQAAAAQACQARGQSNLPLGACR
jgi:hypothetical protein